MKNFRLYLYLVITNIIFITFIGCNTGPTGCIAEGTQIATPKGDILIENLQIGDIVYSYDIASSRLEPSKVLFIKKSYQPCFQFTINDDRSLTATSSHPIYSPETGKYELAEKWVNKELTKIAFIKQNQNFISLSNKTVIHVGKKVVYDITVESFHANFIANGFVVHNKLPPPQMLSPIDDFAVIRKTDSSLTLSWTVPGHSNLLVSNYEMKISDSGFINYTSNNDLWNYDSVDSLPIPNNYGEKDTLEVFGLESSKTYWFVIQSITRHGHFSMYSNLVVDSTL